jgi:hypothetical protein
MDSRFRGNDVSHRDDGMLSVTLDPDSAHIHVLVGMTASFSMTLDPGSAHIHVLVGMTASFF